MPPDLGDIYILHYGLAHLAGEFSHDEQAAVMDMLPMEAVEPGGGLTELPRLDGMGGMLLKGAAPADLFICGRCASTFELAWHLLGQKRLADWGAALALSQNAGRGQMRRPWFSPIGNLHVSFKLPQSPLFAGNAATVLLGWLFTEAFRQLGLEVFLKWPNDLVLKTPDGYGKLGGILLEERGGALVAGLGVNCVHLPDKNALREGAVLPAARLPENFDFLAPVPLWLALVRYIIMLYGGASLTPHTHLLRRAEQHLLWRGMEVQVSDDAATTPVTGVVSGLSPQGGLVLLVRQYGGVLAEQEFVSGGIAGAI